MSCLFCCKKDPIISAYEKAEIVLPPKELDSIYVDPQQTDETLKNLAQAYFAGKYNEHQGVQLFEIPQIIDNCREYSGRSYDMSNEISARPIVISGLDDENGWRKLSTKVDFTCRKGFEKVYHYKKSLEDDGKGNHWARQWGDGTTLHKMGRTEKGATPVLRMIDPNHPKITNDYGKVKEIWIRRYPSDVPKPRLRFQSIHARAEVIPGQAHQLQRTIQRLAGPQWEACYEELVKKRNALREDGLERKE